MAIGCLAESFNNCKAALTIYQTDFMKIIASNCQSSDSGLNRNCAYAIGVVAESA